MERGQQNFAGVHRPREGVLDAEWLRHIAEANTRQAQQLSNISKRFKTHEFIAKLKDKFRPRGETAIDWVALGKDAGVLFRTVPPMQFLYVSPNHAILSSIQHLTFFAMLLIVCGGGEMFGCLRMGPLSNESKKRKLIKRAKKSRPREVERPEDVADTTQHKNNAADRFRNVSNLLQEKKSCDLFDFVVNPASFSQVSKARNMNALHGCHASRAWVL